MCPLKRTHLFFRFLECKRRSFPPVHWVAALLALSSVALSRAAVRYEPRLGDPLQEKSSWKGFEGPYIDGLHCIDVAPSGNVWFGVWRTVQKYDGAKFTRYGEEQADWEGRIRVVKESLTGIVYAATNRAVFRLQDESWDRIGDLSLNPSSRAMYEAADGSIWFVAARKLVSIIDDEIRESRDLGFRATDLTIDADGFIWVVGSAGQVVKYARVNGEAVEVDHWSGLFRPKKAGGWVNADIESTSDGRIWVICSRHEQGPLYLDRGEREWGTYDLNLIGGTNRNFSLLEYAEGEVLISGEDHLYRFSDGYWTVYDEVPVNVSTKRSRLLSNGDGYVWLWLVNDRLARIDLGGNRTKRYLGLNFQCELDNGAKCFISESGQAVIQDVDTDQWVAWDESDGVISDPRVAVASPFGLVWYAGSHAGQAAVAAFDGSEWTRHLLPELGSMVSHQSVIVDSRGGILLGSGQERGLSSYKGGVVRFWPENGVYRKDYVETGWKRVVGLAEAADGSLVVANRALRRKTPGVLDKPLIPKRLTGSWVDDFFLDEDDGVWFSSWGRGIAHLSKDGVKRYTVDDSLDSNYVSNLLKLSNGNILALSETGLNLFDGQSWRPWDSLLVSGVREGSGLRETRNGEIWVNTANRSWNFRSGSSSYNDGQFETVRYVPDRLPPQSFIEVKDIGEEYPRSAYVALSGRDQWGETPMHKLEFSYRLGGGDWSPFSKERTLFFPNLAPGEHLLEVRARDRDGNIDLSPSQKTLSVVVPFWQRKSFLYLSICGGLLTFLLIVALIVQRYRHIVEVDRVRMRFLTNISHELRSPLALIIWPLEKIRNLARTEEENDQVNIAYRNAKRLNQLVEQLLDYRKAEGGRLDLCPKNGDMVSYLKVIVADFENLALSRQQELKFFCDEMEYKTQFDDDVLRKIVDNLISNALKFSPSETRISVSLRFGAVEGFGDDRVRLVVEDEGQGIDKETLKNIFEPFYCAKNRSNRKMRSYGVGLALVKELVDLCGGNITAQSPLFEKNGIARGSRFTLELPSLPRAIEIDNAAVRPLETEGEDQGAGGRLVPFRGDRNENDDTVILLVDDHAELREYVAAELVQDYRVIQASDGASGLEKAIDIVPDVILSDVVMPEMDGVAFCRSLRENPLTSHIPVILQTSLASEESEAAGLDAGAVDYVTKPVSIPVLKKRIENHLENRRRYAELVQNRILTREEGSTHPKEDSESKFIELVRDVLSKNWDDFGFNAEVLASEMGMSRSSFYRKFNAVTDTSPAELIKNYRLDKAAELLSEGCLVSEVSDRIGYSETSPFYRAFKKRFGCSPSDYRKKKGA